MAKKSAASSHQRREREDNKSEKQRKRRQAEEVSSRRPTSSVATVSGSIVKAGESPPTADPSSNLAAPPRHDYPRLAHGNALGLLVEKRFADPSSPCRSYSDLERRSGISREALSRYVTSRTDRRRSPTIDTLAAMADALHLSLEDICRAAAATARGVALPPQEIQQSRREALTSLAQTLNDAQFSAIIEIMRQMQPVELPRR
jgi:transcriptional regulator with XRE-family HTH domain